MFATVKNAFKIKEIRKKVFFTFLMLVVIRLGSQLPVPGVDRHYFSNWFAAQTGDAFNFLDAFTGGSFLNMSILALNITPYITSSIIMQLLTIAIPKLEEMQRDGEDGRKKIASITRYVTVALALLESGAMAIGFGRQGLLEEYNALNVITVIAAMTAGSAFLMWIGERITENGIGNGISIVLVINIISRLPQDINNLFEQFVYGKSTALAVVAAAVIIAIIIGMVAGGSGCCFKRRCAQDSGTVCKKSAGKKNGWRPDDEYSAEGKYFGSYPDYLCIFPYAASPHCQLFV